MLGAFGLLFLLLLAFIAGCIFTSWALEQYCPEAYNLAKQKLEDEGVKINRNKN